MSEQNMLISRELLEGIWNRQDLSLADKYIHPELMPQGPGSEGLPPGPEGQKIFVQGMLNAFPDTQCTIVHQEAEGDMVRTWARFVGTQTGPLMGIPPTGRRATVEVVITDYFENGIIVESISEWDPNEMMRQLGVG
jgi:predicted ester cyclase